MQVLQEALELQPQQVLLPQVEPFFKAVSQHLLMVHDDPEAGTFKFHFPKHASLKPFILQLILGAWCALGGGIFVRCHTNYQSFTYSPLFSEYEIIIDDLFNARDDQDMEDSEGNAEDEGDESEEP